jgi:hypothetical protein
VPKEMKMKVTILAGFAMCMTLAACTLSKTDSQSDIPKPIDTHQVQFRMSNQSIQEPLAYVEIQLDGKQVFFGGLHVATQHNYFTFTTVSEGKPSSVTISTTVDHAPPEGRTSKRQFPVDQNIPLIFDVNVHGTNIFVNQVEKLGLTS